MTEPNLVTGSLVASGRASSIARGAIATAATDGLLVAVSFFLLLFGLLVAFQPSILSGNQLQYIVLNGSIALALAATGLTLVVIVGGLDLSSAGVIALVNAMLATKLSGSIAQQTVIIVGCLVVGAAAGLINGFITTSFDLEPVVVTLGTSFVLGGLALLLLPEPKGVEPDASAALSALTSKVGPLPVSGLVLVALAVAWIVVRRSALGTALVAVGSDAEAAAQAGINVRRTRILAFVWAGVFYAAAGIMLTSQTSGGDPSVGAPYLLGAFAAVVIGGIRLGGGRGSVIGALLGAMSLTIAVSVLFVIGVSSFWTFIARGALLLLAVAAQSVLVWTFGRVVKPPEPIVVTPMQEDVR